MQVKNQHKILFVLCALFLPATQLSSMKLRREGLIFGGNQVVQAVKENPELIPNLLRENRGLLENQLEAAIANADEDEIERLAITQGSNAILKLCIVASKKISNHQKASLLTQGLDSIGLSGLDRVLSRILSSPSFNIHATKRNGETVLFTVARYGHTRAVETLIRRGARVDVVNNAGDTPLICASRNGHASVVQLLIGNGADVNFANPHTGINALLAARENNHTKIENRLKRKGASLDLSLIQISGNGHPDAVKALVLAGANPNSENEIGLRPLTVAAAQNKPDTINALLESGALIEATDSRRNTPLIKALQHDCVDAALFLIRRNANPNAANADGLSPLHIAASRNQTGIEGELIDVGADTELTDPQGETAFVKAVANGHVDSASLLLQRGANIDVSNAQRETPLILAALTDNLAMVNLLKKNIDIKKELFKLRHSGKIQAAKALANYLDLSDFLHGMYNDVSTRGRHEFIDPHRRALNRVFPNHVAPPNNTVEINIYLLRLFFAEPERFVAPENAETDVEFQRNHHTTNRILTGLDYSATAGRLTASAGRGALGFGFVGSTFGPVGTAVGAVSGGIIGTASEAARIIRERRQLQNIVYEHRAAE